MATRPARSTAAPVASPSIRPSGDASTPAAQTLVTASMRRSAGSVAFVSTPVASRPVTIGVEVELDTQFL